MIYNDEFIWLHFPKCAGSKIETLFKKYFSDIESLHQDIFTLEDDPTISWHDSISQREERDVNFSLNDRTIICPFRRLPSWLESRYSFEYNRSPNLAHDPNSILKGMFLEQNGRVNNADYYAKKYLPLSILDSAKIRFIRTEFFELDFKSVFGDYLDLSEIPEIEYQQRVNSSKKNIPDSVITQLYTQKETLYNNCPYWQMIEKMAYKN